MFNRYDIKFIMDNIKHFKIIKINLQHYIALHTIIKTLFKNLPRTFLFKEQETSNY